MEKATSPVSRAELLPLPSGKGVLGEIFESSILHDMRHGAGGMRNRHYVARAVVLVLEVHDQAHYGDETGREVPLKAGSCFLVDPVIGHRYGPAPGSRWTEMYISFRGPIFDALEMTANLMRDPVRHLPSVGEWEKKLRNVLPHERGVNDPDACNGRLISFLMEAFTPAADEGDMAPWVAIAKRMLERESLTVAEVAIRLSETTGFAPETLRKRFREVTGVSMKTWQLAGRVATARSLLARGTMTQKEIAATLGFSSPQHFSRCMRKATGETPGNLSRQL